MEYSEIKELLREAGFGGQIILDETTRKKYAVDESVFELMPEMVVVPNDETDIQVLVKTVDALDIENTRDISLTVRAAGTGLSGGSLNDSIIVDMCQFTALSDISISESGKATMISAPGVYFRDLDAKARRADYFFPSYPSSRDICTIGGMVANNAAGPNSLKYGHTSEFIESLRVVLHDGSIHTFRPLNYEELTVAMTEDTAAGKIYREIWELLDEEEELIAIKKSDPKYSKNTAGYNLWKILNTDSVADFKSGKGTFSLTPVICGSQGTIGIVTNITCSLLPIQKDSDLLVIPVYDLAKMGDVIGDLLKLNPYNVELFDDITFAAALKHPLFFKNFFKNVGSSRKSNWLRFSWELYIHYLFRVKTSIPLFTLMIKFDGDNREDAQQKLVRAGEMLEQKGTDNFVLSGSAEDMLWRVRASSYSLVKLGKKNKRPAAFLEDMTVAPEKMSPFLKKLGELLKDYDAEYAVHGHGGNGHFHFYPLMDFTNPETPEKIVSMANDFYTLAHKHGGGICGEHNDGIIRTPYLELSYDRETIDLFERFEHVFDPKDIFNPGKKVNPRFDIQESIRKRN